jgi:hypothetical protein
MRRMARSDMPPIRAAGASASSCSKVSTTFPVPLARSLARCDRSFGTAPEVAGQIDRGRRGSSVSESDNFFPALVVRPARTGVRRATDRGIGDLRREERNRLRPAKPAGENKIRQPEPQEFGGGIEFRDGGRRLRGRTDRIAILAVRNGEDLRERR